MNANIFYTLVKDLVKAENITIEVLCQKINLEYGTYKSMRARCLLPRFNDIVKMSEILNVSLDYLAYGHEKDSANDEVKIAIKNAAELIIREANQIK